MRQIFLRTHLRALLLWMLSSLFLSKLYRYKPNYKKCFIAKINGLIFGFCFTYAHLSPNQIIVIAYNYINTNCVYTRIFNYTFPLIFFILTVCKYKIPWRIESTPIFCSKNSLALWLYVVFILYSYCVFFLYSMTRKICNLWHL